MKFKCGDRVRVQDREIQGHCRTPYYLRGREGVIEQPAGEYRNPEELAYHESGLPKRELYRVRLRRPTCGQDTQTGRTIRSSPISTTIGLIRPEGRERVMATTDHHDHDHAPIEDGEGAAAEYEILEQAVRELLIERGVLSAADITQQIEDTDSRHPGMGAQVVAKAWVEPEFRDFLRRDAKAAVESLGIDMSNAPELIALEDTPGEHHVVVCTLCSCYPRKLLGVPPAWYKSPAYRSRVVNDPRGVLAEFGTRIPTKSRSASPIPRPISAIS